MRRNSNFGNGIEAAASEWMATSQAAQSEPDSTARAKTLDRFAGIVRARRIIFAGGKIHGRKINLISAEKHKQHASSDAGPAFDRLNNIWRNIQASALRSRLRSSSVSRENSIRATEARG